MLEKRDVGRDEEYIKVNNGLNKLPRGIYLLKVRIRQVAATHVYEIL